MAASFRKKARKQGLTFLDRTAGPQLISLLEQTRQTGVHDQREIGKRKGDENVDPADHLDCEVMLDVIINSIFDLVDADDSGELDEDEMRVCLGLLGLSSTPTDVHRAMASVDIDRSDTISRDEFYSFIYLGFLVNAARTDKQPHEREASDTSDSVTNLLVDERTGKPYPFPTTGALVVEFDGAAMKATMETAEPNHAVTEPGAAASSPVDTREIQSNAVVPPEVIIGEMRRNLSAGDASAAWHLFDMFTQSMLLMQRGRGIGGITGRAFLTVADALELARVAADVQRSLASHDTTVRKSEVTSSFALAIMRTRATLRAERKQAERDAERKQGDSDAEDTLSCSSSSSGMSVSSGSEQEDDADNLLLEEGEEDEQESNASEDGEDEQESDASEDGEAARGAVDESPSAQRIATDSKRASRRKSSVAEVLSEEEDSFAIARVVRLLPCLQLPADARRFIAVVLGEEAFLPRDKEGNRKARAVANARSRQARLRLRAQMGAAWRPMLGLYSGHYCLDLRRPLDMLAASKLAAAAAAEAAFSRLHSRAKRVDSSQRGNWENFRCESAGRHRVALSADWFRVERLSTPVSAVRFEYVPTTRPARGERLLSRKRFDRHNVGA